LSVPLYIEPLAGLSKSENSAICEKIAPLRANQIARITSNFKMDLINDVNTVHALKKHLVAFLGLKELARKFGLGDFDIKVFRMAPK